MKEKESFYYVFMCQKFIDEQLSIHFIMCQKFNDEQYYISVYKNLIYIKLS